MAVNGQDVSSQSYEGVMSAIKAAKAATASNPQATLQLTLRKPAGAAKPAPVGGAQPAAPAFSLKLGGTAPVTQAGVREAFPTLCGPF
jgi:hypothetical protein